MRARTSSHALYSALVTYRVRILSRRSGSGTFLARKSSITSFRNGVSGGSAAAEACGAWAAKSGGVFPDLHRLGV